MSPLDGAVYIACVGLIIFLGSLFLNKIDRGIPSVYSANG